MKRYLFLTIPLLMILSSNASAQELEDDLNIIELELEQGSTRQEPAPSFNAEPENVPVENQESAKRPDVKQVNVSDLSDLSLLAPFKEVSVIQKRFMPKTERVQLFGGLGIITNDPYFNTISIAGKASYFFSETWGLELNYFGNSTSEAKITEELKDAGVNTKSLVKPNSFVGVDAVYVPIYGKMSWIDEKIIPYDLYFSAGFGTTNTNQGSAGTVHLATGQIFAITKGVSFRWDFSWNFFSANVNNEGTSNYNNLFLTAGVSFFFPEAGYR
ncbi:MAG: outer membrane beta-barrel domain-containing protein [Bdellovibrionia bacterium]